MIPFPLGGFAPKPRGRSSRHRKRRGAAAAGGQAPRAPLWGEAGRGLVARWSPVLALVALGVIGCSGGGGGGGGGSVSTAIVDTNNPLAGSPNELDRAALATLTSLGLGSSRLSDDTEFLRRVTADVAGRFPTEEELAAFQADKRVDKRAQVIERLLNSPEYPAHWARDVVGPWLGVRDQAFDNAVELDLVRDVPFAAIIDALCSGAVPQFDKTFGQPYEKVDRIVLAFTGMTGQCARCHDHKLTAADDDPRWVQDDIYGLYAFFANNNGEATKVDLAGKKFGKPVAPSFVLDGYAKAPKDLPALGAPLQLRRATFSQLLRQSDAFARGTSHRIWAELKSPLLDSNQFVKANLDAMGAPAVLAALAKTFKQRNTSLKGFLRDCLNSRLYQLTADSAAVDTAIDGIARHKMRRHHAEVIEKGYRALAGVDMKGTNEFFRENFGYPFDRESITSRRDDVNSAQCAILMNSSSVAGVISSGPTVSKLVADVDDDKIALDQAIVTLFRRALSRDPSPDELQVVLAEAKQCQAERSTREALEDVAAGLAASIEFSGH